MAVPTIKHRKENNKLQTLIIPEEFCKEIH